MVNGFLQYIQYERNFSSHTVLSYRNDLNQFLSFSGIQAEQFQPDNITAQHIQQWVLFLMQSKISSVSIGRKISTLKSFWKYLQKRNYTNQNPALKIIIPKTKKPLPVFFKEKEVVKVLDDPYVPDDFEKIRNLLIIEMLYLTGIRLSELLNIEMKDVDFTTGELKVTGKRNKQRIIPLGEPLLEKTRHYLQLREEISGNNSNNLFLRKNGEKMYPKLVYNIVHRLMSEVCTLPKVSPHVMRHSFATALLNGGADINAVKDLLGHSSLAATQVYTHTGFGELHNIYKRAHPRAK